jgi:hypothetical protein
MSGRVNRWLRIAGTVLLILLTVAGAKLILNAEPPISTQNAPFIRTGTVGDTLDVLDYSVTVTGVRGAHEISIRSGPVQTGGIFILVHAVITAYSKPVTLPNLRVFDGHGVGFKLTDKINQDAGLGPFEPGSPADLEYVYELPTAAAADHLTARFSLHDSGDSQYETYADVDLGITAAEVASWNSDQTPANPQPLRLMP